MHIFERRSTEARTANYSPHNVLTEMLLDITNSRRLAPDAEDADGLLRAALRHLDAGGGRPAVAGVTRLRSAAAPPVDAGLRERGPSPAFRARRYWPATPAELLSAAAAASAAVDADAENADPQQDDGSASWVTMRARGGGGLKPRPLSEGSGLTPRPPSDDIDSGCGGAKTLRRSTGSGLLPAYYSSPQTPQHQIARRRGRRGAARGAAHAVRLVDGSSPVNSEHAEHAAVAAVAAAGADWQQLQIAELAA